MKPEYKEATCFFDLGLTNLRTHDNCRSVQMCIAVELSVATMMPRSTNAGNKTIVKKLTGTMYYEG